MQVNIDTSKLPPWQQELFKKMLRQRLRTTICPRRNGKTETILALLGDILDSLDKTK
jgi:hypothetical protein